jgi:hypothetical protein
MALVETALPPEALLGDGWGGLSPDAALTLSVPSVAEPLQARTCALQCPPSGAHGAALHRSALHAALHWGACVAV